MRRLSLTLTAVVALGLLATGCGGDDSPAAEPDDASPSVSGSETLTATWPLTGLTATGDEQVDQKYPVLVTKIDNTASSSPQVGLASADLVVEELVEGGLTRLAVFYYSQLPEKVGPVRSMRASDIGIVSPVGASVVTSGAAGRTIERIRRAGITYYQEGAAGIYRDTARAAPYNVFANLREIARTAKIPAARPEDYLPWGEEGDQPGGRQARTINASFSSGHTTTWVFRGDHYVNENSNAPDDDQFPADTVLVLRVQVGDAGYLDPAGSPVPETTLEGTGAAILFHGGRMMRGTWSKDALDAPLTLATKKGELTVPPGHTWIELVPAPGGDPRFSNGNVTVAK